MTDHPVDPAGATGAGGPRRGKGPLIAVACAAAVVAGLIAFLVIRDDDEKEEISTTSTSTSVAVTTSIAAPTTVAATSTTNQPATTRARTAPVDVSTAVWPTASGPAYTTPVAAARGFAVDFVGFKEPIVGAFKQGDARSGEVDVRAKANGPATTVLVRQLGSGGRWFVLGSTTPNIQPSEPAALAKVASPVRVWGTSTAFEANVSVEVRQDGVRRPIGTGFVMGGANGEMGPFDGTVTFERPASKAGAILFLTESAEDGRVWEASTVRVSF